MQICVWSNQILIPPKGGHAKFIFRGMTYWSARKAYYQKEFATKSVDSSEGKENEKWGYETIVLQLVFNEIYSLDIGSSLLI